MYHEKQYLMHCAVHTLNNLFQEPWATADLMEGIAKELFDREADVRKESGMGRTWINPYKSAIPQVGYYDINVLIEALKVKDAHISLHAVFNPQDPQSVTRTFEALDTRRVRGIVINRVSRSLLGGLYTSHHFYAIIPCPSSNTTLTTCITRNATASNNVGAGTVKFGVEGEGAAPAPTSPITWYLIDSKATAPEIIGNAAELALHLGMEAREHQGHVFVVSDGNGQVTQEGNGKTGSDCGVTNDLVAG